MDYTVEVKNLCRCFLRRGMAECESFSNIDDAKEYAEALVDEMNKNFCKKHTFSLTQSGYTFTIHIIPR